MENTNNNPDEIKIGDVEYVRKDTIENITPKVSVNGKQYCIFRGHECGVHAGFLIEEKVYGSPNAFKVAIARRLWRWNSNFTLTELANTGVKDKSSCKFSEESNLPVTLLDVYEVIPCTETAFESIKEVPNYDPENS